MATLPDSTIPDSSQSQNRADLQREAKHTPIDWAYDEDDARIYYDDGDMQPTIAYIERDGVAPEQVKADGYLLAAAPALLKACQTLAEDRRMALNGEWDKGDDGFSASLEMLEEVIAKAGQGGVIRHSEDEELVQFTDAKARIAFDRAIAAGILSADEHADNAAAAYMFMGTLEEGDAFKHIDTRQYVYNKQGGAS